MSITPLDRSSLSNKKIVIFDGECAFCNASVLFIRKHNHKNNIFYCSSQSEVSQELIASYNITVSPNDSLIYIKNNKHFIFSSAPLEVAKELDHFWAMLSVFLIVPKNIRDGVYKFIARNRKTIMGTSTTCSLESSRQFEGRILE